MFLLSFALFFIAGQEYSKTKGLKWPVNDGIRRRRHTGAHDGEGGGDGGCWRSGVHRVWSPTGEEKEKLNLLFPAELCAFNSAFGALRAAADAGQVQQRAGRLLKLLVQLLLDLAARPLAHGPLNGRRAARRLPRRRPLVPEEVGVLVAVEALAAGAAGLAVVAGPLVQRGQRRGRGGAGGAALQRHAAVVVVLLGVAAHKDRVGPREVQRVVGVAWREREDFERRKKRRRGTVLESVWLRLRSRQLELVSK